MSDPQWTSHTEAGSEPAVELSEVGVQFRVPTERIVSFKEYILRRITSRLDYRDFWALNSVSFAVGRGEMFGIIGRNGAGKSTLLKVVSRVLTPTRGRIVVRGRVAPLLGLGAGFHPDLTGEENFFMNAAILGYPRSRIGNRLQEVVEFSELEGFIHAPVRTYSSGMEARLGFAVATLFRPDILVLDEVLAVGDAGFQEKCLARIENFLAQGTTILFVSHSLGTVREYCRRVAWLEQGQVAALGPPDEVLDLYEQAVHAGP